MLDELKKETNYTKTENNAVAHNTTNSDLLNFFAQGGALRSRTAEDKIDIFDAAFSENKLLALRTLFYFRDIRGGQGERQTFKDIVKWLAVNHEDTMRKNLPIINEYGRWDDYYAFVQTPLENDVFELLKKQFNDDLKNETPSLLAKWLKSENTSSKESKKLAKLTAKKFGLDLSDYRKHLSEVRKKIKLIETKLSNKEYSSIEYDKVPSKAGLKYKKAFYKNDEVRYNDYLESVIKGEKKINTGTLYPYEIVERILDRGDTDKALNVMWENLPNYIEGDEYSIVVADTSGSMYGRPMAISVSLAMYCAERNKGKFHNHFITFSEHPELQEISGTGIVTRANNLSRAQWDMNTNVEAVFNLILNTAIKYKTPKKEMIKKVYIVSDMEFDDASDGNTSQTLFTGITKRFEENGYKMPLLVFWNVDARNKQFPMTMDDRGIQFVSGCSPSIFKNMMSGKIVSAYQLMLEVLNVERYEKVCV